MSFMLKILRYRFMTDNEIDLRLTSHLPVDLSEGRPTLYIYHIYRHRSREPMGHITFRLNDKGCEEYIYYTGNIGYGVDEPFRGHGYARKACVIIKRLAQAFNMPALIITCNPDNLPSKRTCENLGARLDEIVDLPPHNIMYKMGERQKCIFVWEVDDRR